MSLGNRIKQIRGDISQHDLAKLLKVDRSTVASWEIDRREPDLATLAKLADLFNVSVDWLAGRNSRKANLDASAWDGVIALALANNIKPENVKALIIAALNIKP